MMNIANYLSLAGLSVYFFSSIAPLIRSSYWWVRVWDFPRLQMLAVGLFFLLLHFYVRKNVDFVSYLFSFLFVIGALLDLYRTLPYSPLWKVESLVEKSPSKDSVVSLITVNVLQDNKDASRMLKLIKEKLPDMVFLLEVDERWINDLKSLDDIYPFSLKKPQDDTYGLAFYSKLPLENAQINYLIEDHIPSLRTILTIPSGVKIEVFGLHPTPPGYEWNHSTERDAELIQVAKFAEKSQFPVIVMGDLNDVAWSHTTRLFRRISRMLDPRIGRGPYTTFPTAYPFLRFPLDYVFHSDTLKLVDLERLPDVGSDHLPMFAAFSHNPKNAKDQEAPKVERGDRKDAKETIEKAK
jgi:endonuclease/exonuclease/phosphatase (EEP) superfamily protein YafD